MFIPGWQVLCVFNHSTLEKKKMYRRESFSIIAAPFKGPPCGTFTSINQHKTRDKKQLCLHTQTINIYIYIESRSTFKCTARVRVTVDPEDRSALGLVTSPGESSLRIADKFLAN